MPYDFSLSSVLPTFLLPPGLSVFLLLLAVLCRDKKRQILLWLGLASLYVFSIPVTVGWLRGIIEIKPSVTLEHSAAEAIVVLGGGRQNDVPEYGGDTIAGVGLERLRYAAILHKKTGLPILASGGSIQIAPISEAKLMSDVLREFGVEVTWLEEQSRTTYENALFSSRLLKGIGIGEILLVTQAWHMPRAQEAFEHVGIRVIPAPTMGMGKPEALDFRAWIPSASALQMSYYLTHELLGRWWYRYHYYQHNNAP
jgi:uncharacterized SAM-binding protein YcdF (DUF218 family)